MQQERRQKAHPLSQGRLFWVLSVVLLLAACSSTRWDHTPQEEHVVRSGETLFTIGWRYGKDYRDLAEWNRLGNGSLIYPGQVLRLTPPAGVTARQGQPEPVAASRPLPPIPTGDPPPWIWPTAGSVAVSFGDRPGSTTGILIDGTLNQRILAAADGRVVYSGSGLIGYGRLIIIKHNDTYLSAYGHNASLLVKEGDSIKKGQRIATMGEGPGRKPRLHFEIRRNGKPVNPRQYLPAR